MKKTFLSFSILISSFIFIQNEAFGCHNLVKKYQNCNCKHFYQKNIFYLKNIDLVDQNCNCLRNFSRYRRHTHPLYVTPLYHNESFFYEKNNKKFLPTRIFKSFNGIITSDRKKIRLDQENHLISGLQNEDQIKFYPDFSTFGPYDEVEWIWHYDSNVLDCEEITGTLNCIIKDIFSEGDVWVDFLLPDTDKKFPSNKIFLRK